MKEKKQSGNAGAEEGCVSVIDADPGFRRTTKELFPHGARMIHTTGPRQEKVRGSRPASRCEAYSYSLKIDVNPIAVQCLSP